MQVWGPISLIIDTLFAGGADLAVAEGVDQHDPAHRDNEIRVRDLRGVLVLDRLRDHLDPARIGDDRRCSAVADEPLADDVGTCGDRRGRRGRSDGEPSIAAMMRKCRVITLLRLLRNPEMLNDYIVYL